MIAKGCLILFFAFACVVIAQRRPSYASRQPYPVPKDYTYSPPAAPSPDPLATRFGNVPNAVNDPEIAQWAQQWPDDKKPFWLLNAEHIRKANNPELNISTDRLIN